MPTAIVRRGKWNNRAQTMVLFFALTSLNALVGWLMFGTPGLWLALVLSVLGALFAPGLSPVVVLKMFHARPITRAVAPELVELFDELKRRSGLAIPIHLFLIPSRMPNAFATGNDSEAAVAISDGLLRILSPRELAGVMAHELSHIRHRDLRVMVTADAVARVTSLFARVGFLILIFGFPAFLLGYLHRPWLIAGAVMFLAPLFAIVLQLALSRSREFQADLGAVELTRDPAGLASALARIERVAGGHWWQRVLGGGVSRGQPAWLRTHPPTPERIAALMEVAESLQTPEEAESAPTLQGPHLRSGRRHLSIGDSGNRVRQGPVWHAASGLWY